DVATCVPGAGRAVAGRVTDLFSSSTHAGINHVVERFSLVEPRPLGKPGERDGRGLSRVADHVLVQSYVLESAIAPVHVGLFIVVDEHRWVDVAGTGLDELVAQWVHERARDLVRDAHTDPRARVVVERDVKKILSVSEDPLWGP